MAVFNPWRRKIAGRVLDSSFSFGGCHCVGARIYKKKKNTFLIIEERKKWEKGTFPKELLFLNSHSRATKRYILNHCNLVIMLNYNFVKQCLKRPPLSSSDTASWNYQTVRAPLLP